MSTGLQTTNFDWQNNYIAHLSADITSSATDIFLDTVPTVTEGILVIDPDTPANLEVILYTSKTATKVVCHAQGRGYDGSTAIAHLSGTKVIMAPVGDMFRYIRTVATTTPQGWSTVASTPSTITYNGNGSYDCVYNSVDLTSTLNVGMRQKFTRTVTAPTYMGGAFNGTNHYFTKATPSGTLGTVTNNFTLMGFAEPTAYALGTIEGRYDNTTANGLALRMNADGTVSVIVSSGGSGNFRSISTYQSLPLNKKTHVAATWTSGTVVIYFNGLSVPVATAVTGGTAPTTAGTGGDFSIGRLGASNSQYFTGYISGVGAFDAVLSAATIRSYYGQVLSGAETNCIGAWSLNNTANDQNAAGNNLTATNSVGYTVRSPYATQADGTNNGTTEYAIITKTAFSTNTTLTVQVPEGCALPTSGGISAVSYSTQKAPYGFPADNSKWLLSTLILAPIANSGSVASTIYNAGGINLNVPIGAWRVKGDLSYDTNPTSTTVSVYTGISSSSSAFSDKDLTELFYQTNLAAGNLHVNTTHVSKMVNLTAATPYYALQTSTAAISGAATIRGASGTIPESSQISAEFAYL